MRARGWILAAALALAAAAPRVAAAQAPAPPAAAPVPTAPPAPPPALGAKDPKAPTVVMRPVRTHVAIAEPFTIHVTVVHPPGMTVTLPDALPLPEDTWAELGDRVTSEEIGKDGQVATTISLTVGALVAGEQSFPAIPVGYVVDGEQRQVMSEPVTITVVATIKDDVADKTDFAPTAPPVDVLVRDWTLLFVAGGVVAAGLLIALGVALARRTRKRRAITAGGDTTLALPPHEAALARLRALLGSPLLAADDRRPLYGELTDAVRLYLSASLGPDALAATSRELDAVLASRVEQPVRAALTALLTDADLVKFARAQTSRDTAEAAVHEALRVCAAIGLLAPVPEPKPEPEPEPVSSSFSSSPAPAAPPEDPAP